MTSITTFLFSYLLVLLINTASSFVLPSTFGVDANPRHHSALFAAANEGFLAVSRSDGSEHQLAYRIVRPMALSSNQAAPIVALHGGPSVPSNYLYPLEQVVPYRSIVFYDQLGCGKSDQPADISQYSTADSVQDLIALLEKLGVRRFHLYGQSYGGILAFEFMKYMAESKQDFAFECLSAILSSGPTNVKEIEEEADRLVELLAEANPNATPEELGDLFQINHQCRMPEMPPILKEAYENAGTVWRGTDAIQDYVAEAPSEEASRMPSALIMRGEYDFVSQESVDRWKSIFNTKFLRYKTLEGCSHHGLLELGAQYGDIVDSYFDLEARGIAAYEPLSMIPNANGQHLTPYPVNRQNFRDPTHFVPRFEQGSNNLQITSILLLCEDPDHTLHYNGKPLYPNFYVYECSNDNPLNPDIITDRLSCKN